MKMSCIIKIIDVATISCIFIFMILCYTKPVLTLCIIWFAVFLLTYWRLLHFALPIDSVSTHQSSIQGESDSENELIDTISSNLDSMFSSDSSDADASDTNAHDEDDDAFESSEKPVFLTAIGPVHVDAGPNYIFVLL